MRLYIIITKRGSLIGVYLNKSKADRMMKHSSISKHAFLIERDLNEEI